MTQHLLSDDTGEPARPAVRCGNPPILLLPPLKIDGSERDPQLSYSTEIALAPFLCQCGSQTIGVDHNGQGSSRHSQAGQPDTG